jgi:hypothetical protein
MKNERVSPFRIDIAPELLNDLRQRLKNTRWSYQVKDSSWDAGTDLDYLKELVAYWLDTYDWRKHEAEAKEHSRQLQITYQNVPTGLSAPRSGILLRRHPCVGSPIPLTGLFQSESPGD